MESDTGIMCSFVRCHFPPQECKQGGDVPQGCSDSILLPPGPGGHGKLRGQHKLRDPGHKIVEKESSAMYGGTWKAGRRDPGKCRKDSQQWRRQKDRKRLTRPKHGMFCLGSPGCNQKVSNTNSLLTLNSNALPTEPFVTPFADWRGFFLKRECPCISLYPQDILAAQWLCYLNPLRFCFSPPPHC